MVKHSIETYGIQPPLALRPKEPLRMDVSARYLARTATEASRALPRKYTPRLKPLLLGATAALMFGFVFDIGPWSGWTGHLLGTADAQEAPRNTAIPANTGDTAVPSEADRAALRYFAREGAVERLEAELRRLRALYPNWQPPTDLLDPDFEDAELQRVYQLVGEQRYAEAREAIAERRRRDPTYEPPVRLIDILDLADVRQELRAASDANNFTQVLSIAEANERILTCEDVDSIWRVAQAFAETGRPQRAYDAYAYVINSCTEGQAERAASLQKAAQTLDQAYVTQLFALGSTDAAGVNEFDNARLEIIRGAVARGGEQGGEPVSMEWLELLAASARTGNNLQDAMLVGFYLYRQNNPAEGAQWFRFALDGGLGSDAAEAYITALRATDVREDDFLAREVAYQWREQTPELMESYLDAMSTILTADELGERSIEDVEQDSVDRFVPIVINQRDPNGAQALGWYAFNTCQFIISEEWFITSANWVPTEAALFGLALSRLRLGDQAGFQEVVDEWGPLYPAVRALAVGGDVDPEAPVSGDIDDPTQETGVSSVICDPEERERLRNLIVEQQNQRRAQQDPLIITEAGSLTAAPIRVRALTRRPDGFATPEIPRRSVVIQPHTEERRGLLHRIQANTLEPLLPLNAPQPIDPAPQPTVRQAAPQAVAPVRRAAQPSTSVVRSPVRLRDGRLANPVRRQTTVVSAANRPLDTGGATVRRRVRQGLSTTVDDNVRDIVNRSTPTRRVRRRRSGGGGGAQAALGKRNFAGCVKASDRAIRNGTLSAADASARGYCLLELKRPVEAAQAFQLAQFKARYGTSAAADAAYGATLAAIANNMTQEAALAAASAPMSRPRRTETQISILTQRAIAANEAKQYTAALHFLEQRNKIAPLQKDLMLLQGFAYQNVGDYKNAKRMFDAVNKSGSTSASRRASQEFFVRGLPPSVRGNYGNSLN
ncbi:hypothetical protein RDV64_04675 [Acuticoccus sp. MNP-M23]|uniref:hypothetical protein n=1 Tax=Acuticoccus sp. MNP-M23 TaxID=3072793 RepID=UPI002815A501|nr:hypothetical protein [Acuticoccus sp. MNP-M23]WMS43700.1 hypothetical protein RDV64_04675 [Acuticoccus sp. MNP-M23]